MKIEEIVEELKYYKGELPKEALKEAIDKKEEMIPKLLDMLEFTKNNLEKIYNEEDEFFGYIYAFFLLAQFRERRAFPYLIDLLNKDEEIVDYILGEDYPGNLPRLLASTYNGDDEALFSIIENRKINEFVRSSTLQTFAILYLYGKKDREFIVNYFKKLINEKEDDDYSYLYKEILDETMNLRLIELDGLIDKIFNVVDTKEEIQELKDRFEDEKYEIDMEVYPFKDFYEYIDDTIEIMEDWQCFRYKEDEEYEHSENHMILNYVFNKRYEEIDRYENIGRNELCPCGSGKKFKKCCMNKYITDDVLESLDFIDMCIAKGIWYLEREENKKACELLRFAWGSVREICINNNIKSIEEYDKKYKGYDFLSNWLQEYDEILELSNKKDRLIERIRLCDDVENTFDLNDEEQLYWKEHFIRARANTEFRLSNKEKATNIIEDYLKEEPNWTWGYVEMADWYMDKRDINNYDLKKAEEILLRAEKVDNEENDIEDVIAIFERLLDIYKETEDKDKEKLYEEKINKLLIKND